MLEHWYAALRSPSGVCVRVSDVTRVRAQLYAARKEAMDPNLENLAIVQSPTAGNELWIVHKPKAADDATD